jgi:MFS transporter, OFA family, oxalate/formate antiporter
MTGNRSGKHAIVACSIAIFWPGAFIFGFPGVMAPFWQQSFGVGRGAIGNILFFVLAAIGIFMFFVGRWQEKFGQRAMISVGAVICGISPLLLVYSGGISTVYLWAFLTGLASCFIYIPTLTTVQQWFPMKRGLVSGLVNFIFGLSAAIMAPIFGYMLERFGYANMNLILAGVSLLIGISAAQFTEGPHYSGSTAAKVGGAPKFPSFLEHSLTVKQGLRTRSFRFLWLTWALQGSAGIAMVTLSTTYALSKGLKLESAVLVLAFFNIANGVSRLLTGYLSDRLGRNSTMSAAFFLAGLAYFLLPYTESLSAIAVPAAIIGFAFGTLFAVSAPLAVDCFGIAHFGAIFGLVFTAYGFVAGPLGPSLGGYLLDSTKGNFALVFGYLGVFCLISSVLIRFVRPPLFKQ